MEAHVIGFEGGPADYGALREGSASLESLHFSQRGPLALHRLRQRVRDLRPHVIHTHSFQPGVWGRLFGAEARLVATVHNVYPYFREPDLRSRLKRGLERESLQRRPARVVCVSQGVRAALPPDWPAAEVVENGIVIERVRALAAKRNLRRAGMEGPLLVSAGRLETQKGYDLLLHALAKVRRDIPARLSLIGDGTQRLALEQLAHRLGVADAVSFAGYQENPFPYLRAGDLYVSSSRHEGFGQSVLEAMSLGLPVVSTSTAGMGEVLRDGQNGFLAPTIDAAGVALAIGRALDDRVRLERVARAGLTLVEQRFHLQHTSRRYQAIYQEMIG
jgi:glycosyltransferase involved in cell wall biosynthesis